VKKAIVIPSYNELDSLPVLLDSLVSNLSTSDAVIVVDDSSHEIYTETKIRCQKIFKERDVHFLIINNAQKGGRGAAVLKGMKIATSTFPNLEFLIECDADGSHTVEDILRIMQNSNRSDMLIGSRYLSESSIIGWPLSRRVFSKILNLIIPKLMQVPATDITNGLRRYSRDAISLIISYRQMNTGFIYLTEQAVLINRNGLAIDEIPISFVNRTIGQSSVTWREVVSAQIGLFKVLYRVAR
jgi:dolichol-phosphate mannosyltransferase